MKRLFTFIVVMLVVLSCSANEYKLSNVKIVDGDGVHATIHLGLHVALVDVSIRLAFVDAPETRTKDLLEKEAGLLIKKWLTEKIRKGEKFKLVTGKKEFEKFGRPMGILFIDGIDMCEAMIKNKFVKRYFGEKKKKWQVPFLKYIIKQLKKEQDK